MMTKIINCNKCPSYIELDGVGYCDELKKKCSTIKQCPDDSSNKSDKETTTKELVNTTTKDLVKITTKELVNNTDESISGLLTKYVLRV